MRNIIWFDFDNSPHVQYLLPIAQLLEESGFKTVFTARDYSQVPILLRQRKVQFEVIGCDFGRNRFVKAFKTFERGILLAAKLKKISPIASVSSSRSCVLASWFLRIPRFIICDYEHVELRLYNYLQAFILFPSVIPIDLWEEKGFKREKLIPFPSLKEDISFSDVNFKRYSPLNMNNSSTDMVVIVLRPPSEKAHYFTEESGELFLSLLSFLAEKDDVLIIFSPRYKSQLEVLKRFSWVHQPWILRRPVHFISLMKTADLVVSGGGTMAREAAVLGIPSYSIFKGIKGYVDRYLEREGRLIFIESEDDFSRIKIEKKKGIFYQPKPHVKTYVVSKIMEKLQ